MPEKKSWIEIVLMPMVVVIVGIGGTLLVTQQQQRNLQTITDRDRESIDQRANADRKIIDQRANADREIKFLEIFKEQIMSPREEDRIFALSMLEMLTPELHTKLARAVAEAEPKDSRVGKVAVKEAERGKDRLIPPNIFDKRSKFWSFKNFI